MSKIPVVIGTITRWGDDDYSFECLEMNEEKSSTLYEITEPCCTVSTRGSAESILEELGEAIGINNARLQSIEGEGELMSLSYPLNLVNEVFRDTDAGADIRKLSVWLSCLTEREKKAVELRFKDGLSLREAGEVMGITSERVRQVLYNARVKLSRQPASREILTVSVKEHDKAVCSKDAEIVSLRAKYRDLRRYTEALHDAIAKEIPSLTRILETLPDAYKMEEYISDMPLEDLGLSIWAYSPLKSAGFNTAGQIAKKSKEEVEKIRNLGPKRKGELSEKLKEFGFDPKF